jgi:lactate dehydrogenase-like 2-hydroxyacid dehydrogenase
MVVLSITRLLVDPVLTRARGSYSVWLNEDDHIMSADEIVERSFASDALMICHSEVLSSEVIAKFSDRLKIVANYSVGVDHCDLVALKERGIVVTNTPDVLSDATAEIAMLLLLGASRRAYEGDQMLRLGTWKHWAPVKMNGIQVTSKKLGIVGMGRVGQTVAKRARGFDMEIHYTNRRRLPAELEQGAIYHPTVKSLFETVDMISLNCPATSETDNLINAESIGWMLPQVSMFFKQSQVGTQRLQLVPTFLCCRTSGRRPGRPAKRWVIERSTISTHSSPERSRWTVSSSRLSNLV